MTMVVWWLLSCLCIGRAILIVFGSACGTEKMGITSYKPLGQLIRIVPPV